MRFSDILGQERVKNLLRGALRNGRIAGAYLFVGEDPSVMGLAAEVFATALLCESDAGGGREDPCGECVSCRKVVQRVHPDLLSLQPVDAAIKIEAVRELEAMCRLGPYRGRWKIGIINEADQLTFEAGSRLLKLLEEPPKDVTFILTTRREAALPLTLRSRCQRFIFATDAAPLAGGEEVTARAEQILSSEDILSLFSMAGSLPPDEIPELLVNLGYRYRERLDSPRMGVVVEALRDLELRANRRLTLENMFLQLTKCPD